MQEERRDICSEGATVCGLSCTTRVLAWGGGEDAAPWPGAKWAPCRTRAEPWHSMKVG